MPTTQPCLSCLRVGDRVTNLPLRAHLTASRLTKETDDTQRQNTPATRPKKKGRWQSKPPAAKAQPAASAHTNPLTQFASAELTNGRTRCLFTDDTATIAGEIDEKWIDSIQSADRVTVDGRVELQEGRVVLVVSACRACQPVDASVPDVAPNSVRPLLGPLLNGPSSSVGASGVWLFRIICGELFVMLKPDRLSEDAILEPPFMRWTDSSAAAATPADSSFDPTMHFALEAMRTLTEVKSEEYLIIPNAGLLVRMLCGVILPRPDGSPSILSGDDKGETEFARDHWHHVARAMMMISGEWSESLTQVITSLSWVTDELAESAGVSIAEGDEDDSPEQEEDDGLPEHSHDTPLYDDNDAIIRPADEATPKSALIDAPADASEATTTVPSLSSRDVFDGLVSTSPTLARVFVRDMQRALDSCGEKLRQIRAQAAEEEEKEEEDEEEDAEDAEAEADSDVVMEDASGATDSTARAVSGAPRSGAADFVSSTSTPAKKSKSSTPVDAARIAEVTEQVRALKRAIRAGTKKKVPVSVLTGFLGAGKTTLMNHILATVKNGTRIGVIVNDFSHVNVDAAMLSNKTETLIELSNGTLRSDLFSSVVELVASGRVDSILIESTGIGEPAPIVATFTFELDHADAEAGKITSYGLTTLSEIVQLDCVTTVVDSQAVYARLKQANEKSGESADSASSSRGRRSRRSSRTSPSNVSDAAASASAALTQLQSAELESKSIQTLLTEQLEFCNVLVLNKSDLLSSSEMEVVVEFVKLINLKADIVKATHGKVEPGIIIGSGKFSEQESLASPLLAFAAAEWHASLTSKEKAASESAEYGITSFAYHRRVGFDAHRFNELLTAFESNSISEFSGLLRVKGVFWINQNSSAVGLWQATTPGTKANISHLGGWLLDLSAWDCVSSGLELQSLSRRWHSIVSDRYIQLVFIGVGIDRAAITKRLDQCCMTREELENELQSEEEEEEDEDAEEEDDKKPAPARAAKSQVASSLAAELTRLKPVLDYDPNPNADNSTCALR